MIHRLSRRLFQQHRSKAASPSAEPRLSQQVRQLGKAGRQHAGLVPHEPLGGQPTLQIVLEVKVSERLPLSVADDEGPGALFDGPGRQETARAWHDRFYTQAIFAITG